MNKGMQSDCGTTGIIYISQKTLNCNIQNTITFSNTDYDLSLDYDDLKMKNVEVHLGLHQYIPY